MRNFTRFIAVLGLAGPFALAAPAAQAKTVSASCGATSASFLFWPKGHGARPGAGFPAYPVPHVEVYKGKPTTKWRDSDVIAYLGGDGAAAPSNKCTTKIAKFSSKKVSGGTKRTSAANVACTLGKGSKLIVGSLSTGGARVQALTSTGAVVLDLTIKSSGSKVTFGSACKAKAPPK